ncbi:MAG: helicase DnaB [Synechococcaceae cyanobacterium]|nr:helicase DnaB [Synechococcaceae cyanobacterium]
MRFPWIRARRAGVCSALANGLSQRWGACCARPRLRIVSAPPLILALLVLACAPSLSWLAVRTASLRLEPDHPLPSTSSSAIEPRGLTSEGQRPDPIDFSAAELRELNRRFGVHGPQPRLAQLFTEGLDQLRPLRTMTLRRLEELRPVILAESRRRRINPMLVTAVLFDEMQHAKPGEDSALAISTGLFKTHGPAQLSLEEMVKQGLLAADASPEEQDEARQRLLDPVQNVKLLVGVFSRFMKELDLPSDQVPMASRSPRDAKILATLAYLHNGKLDYPGRVLRYMQDPELHELIYSSRRPKPEPMI